MLSTARKPREKVCEAQSIYAYDGWNVPWIKQPYTLHEARPGQYFLLWREGLLTNRDISSRLVVQAGFISFGQKFV